MAIYTLDQWFKNGDHPEDDCVEMVGQDGKKFLSEGKVVRYFRSPDVSGILSCPLCHKEFRDHGWIDKINKMVCPGNFVINLPNGNRFVCSTEIANFVNNVITAGDEWWDRQLTALRAERDYWKDRSQYASVGVNIHG